MTVKRFTAALLAPAAFAAACALTFSVRPVEFRTSLYDILGDASDTVPAAVRESSSRTVPIMVGSEDAAEARKAADGLVELLPSDCCARVRYRFDGEAFTEMLSMYRDRRAGLASPRDEKLLETPEGRARIARAAVRRYYSSPVPPLFRPDEDPFCLADSFVTSLPVSFSGWSPVDGVLTARRGGMTYVLIALELKAHVADDTDALAEFWSRIDETCDRFRSPRVSVEPCGVPVHTAIAAGRCRTEIGWLTWFSSAFILLLSVAVFRSFRWLPLLLASLTVSASAGGAVLALAFPSVHLVTVVFGTSVLGLVIDYSFHWLLQPAGGTARTRRNLLISFLTTEISLLPLMLSSLAVLRQSAVFLGAGLAAALAYVLLCYPTPASSAAAPRPLKFRIPAPYLLLALVAVCAAFGAGRATFKTDPSSIYRPPARLAEAERTFAELSGTLGLSRGFYVTGADEDLETLLGRERKLAVPAETPRLSLFLPPLEDRLGTFQNILKLYEEHGARQSELLGVDLQPPGPPPRPWTWSDVPPCAGAFVHGKSLVIPSAAATEGPLPDGVRFYQPKRILGEILSALAGEASVRLSVSLAVMFLALAFFCRHRAPAIILPPVVSLLTVVGLLGFTGEDVTLFHVLACFLLVGAGVDYTVFLHSGPSHAFKPAVSSLLTSVAGFGALLFVSFPVVNAFGFVLAVGLPTVFFLALATAPAEEPKTEYGASSAGLEILYIVYRLAGLRFLHFLAACAGSLIWLCSPAVRRASPSWRKVVMFTKSLADKLVVMADSGRLPAVETDGSADARRFIDDVASRKGVFVLSSHCGTIEVLAALGSCDATFHAWMEFERTSVFNRFYLRHARRGKVVIHPISSFGPETVFTAGDALDAGDCLVMAADRGFGRTLRLGFGAGEIDLSQGAFRFARALAHPVYFVACVCVGPCRYRAVIRRLTAESADLMAEEYAQALFEVASAYPDQWFKWEGV